MLCRTYITALPWSVKEMKLGKVAKTQHCTARRVWSREQDPILFPFKNPRFLLLDHIAYKTRMVIAVARLALQACGEDQMRQ